MAYKICTKCGINKAIEYFFKDKKCKDGLSYWCKYCCNENNKLWCKNNKTSVAASHYKHSYGIDYCDYELMILKQNGKCAVCKQSKKLHVDHNHVTNKVRKLLCVTCNTILSYFECTEKRNIFLTYLQENK
jgi:hypothetical protein